MGTSKEKITETITGIKSENIPHSVDGCASTTSASLFNNGKRRCYTAKEVIYRESENVDKVFFIRSGLVKLLSYLPNGRARIVRLHASRHCIGLEGLVGQPYEHTAIAVDDVVVDYIAMSSLRSLERYNPSQYCQMVKLGYKHLVQADKWIADFSTGGIKSRVARMLEFLSSLEYGEGSNMVELLTVHEMADMLGVTQESVSRILAEFKRDDTLLRLNDCVDETYEINANKLHYQARQ